MVGSESSITTIFAYNTAGAKHNIIVSAPLLEVVLREDASHEDAKIPQWAALRNAFNIPKDVESQYFETKPTIRQLFSDLLLAGSANEQKILSACFSILSDSLPDLITFNSSIVDQMAWERVADLELTDGTVEAECDLFSLINEFFCNAIITPIMGSQFPESYQLLASDLSTINQFYYPLALGLPRLFPMSGLPGAMLAKKRLFKNFERFFNELTNPQKRNVPEDGESMSGEETDAETPTPLTALNDFFSEHNVQTRARAAITLQMLHELISELVPLAFWSLLHIQTSAATEAKSEDTVNTIIDEIREETKQWAGAIQPPSIHPSFPAPPEISFAGTARAVSPTSFPYLRSSINEARRLYKASNATIAVTKPITLVEKDAVRPGAEEKWELEADSYVDVGISQALINTSPANFIAPYEYNPKRFSNTVPPSTVCSASDSHELFGTALLLAFVAGTLQLWEIAPAPKKSLFDLMQEAQAAAAGTEPTQVQSEKKTGAWIIPQAIDGSSINIPRKDIRVRIKRKEGLPERRTLRKGR